jgi:hypothetical protein
MASSTAASNPHLATLLADPASADGLALDAIPPLLCQLSALQTALATRLLQGRPSDDESPTPEQDRLLTIDAAAAILGVTPKWLYRHKRLPFVRPLSRKALRVSEAGLRRWLAAKRA